MRYTNQRDSEEATRAKRTAKIAGVSVRYVKYVIRGQRKNENVLKIYMQLQEAEMVLVDVVKQENLLLKAVKELVPFND